MRRERLLTATLLLLAASCRDVTGPTTTLTVPAGTRYQLGVSGTLDGEITTLIAALFPKGLETAAGTRWDVIRDKIAAGDVATARKMAKELSKWVKGKESQMEPPPMNESRAGAAARLVLYMSLYVFEGPSTSPPPEFGAGADATVQIVSPTEPKLVQTEAKKAAARFDAGTVSEETIVVITENTEFFRPKCSGPFTTKYCQYPLFYHYRAFPQQKFQKLVRTSVCHVHREPTEPYDPNKYQPLPGVDHGKLVMLHDLPADANNYTPGGKQIPDENIEVLPRNTTSIPEAPPTVCSGTKYQQPIALFQVLAMPSGVLGKAYAMAARAVNGAATSVGRALTPKSLYAVDNGEEHNAFYFSSFANADSSGHPDLAVTGSAASAMTVLVGDPLTLTYTLSNIGTAHSPVVGTVVRLTPTGETNDPPVELAASLAPGAEQALYPEQSRGGSAAVTIPTDLAPGTYTITAVASSADGLTEIVLENNSEPVAITVLPREVTVNVPFDAAIRPRICNGASACGEYFEQDGFTFESFWFQPSQGGSNWVSAHFHPAAEATNAYEAHHWQGDLFRQGIWIRRADGQPFTLKSIDYRNAVDGSPFEIGTSTIASVSGSPSVAMSASGPYTGFSTTSSPNFQTLLTPGFTGVTQVFITMRGSADWDNIVLVH